LADYSGSITSGGSAQTAAAADANRTTLLIQNASAEDLWINFGTTAVADSPSINIPAGESLFMDADRREFIAKAISIIGATTGSKFTIVDTKG
jgi:hypothetical protein